jgi:STE24 endopeptidase
LKAKNHQELLLSSEDWQKAADYAITREKFATLSLLFSTIIAVLWIVFAFNYIESFINIESLALKSAIIFAIFFAINSIIELPLNFYETFVIDGKFGFNNSTHKLFFTDFVKSLILSIGIAFFAVWIVSKIILSLGENWWIITFFFLSVLLIVLNMLFPLFRKLFDKFEPLDNTEIGAQIKNLLDRVGFKAEGVYKVDASKRDARLNAYFAGLGKIKRVALYDTLLDKLTHPEIIAVLAHELGHFKHRDIFKQMTAVLIALFAILLIFGNANHELFTAFNLSDSPQSLILLFLIFSSPLFFFCSPIFNLISRNAEFGADKFAAETTNADDLKSALIKLVRENRSFPKKHLIYAIWNETHPNVLDRIERLENVR